MIKRNRKGQYTYNFSHTNLSGLSFMLITIALGASLQYLYSEPQPLLVPGHVMAVEPSPALDRTTQLSPTPSPTPSQKPAKARVEPSSEVRAIIERYFGSDAEKAITMVAECENKGWDQKATNYNRNGTIDKGIFQHNVKPTDIEEIKKLEDIEYNIALAYKKFREMDNTFYYWTCGSHVGDYTYLDRLNGVPRN